MDLHEWVEQLGRAEVLDAPAKALQDALKPAFPTGPIKDLVSGTWLGHPLHPLLVHLPIGSWICASLLDLAGGRQGRAAADRLVGFGVLSAVPTATAGTSDWLDTLGSERRIGFVHATGNAVALLLMLASWRARKRGRRVQGVLLALAANGLISLTGYLGGHLAYNQGVGVDTTAFESGPQDWTPVADDADLPEGVPRCVQAGSVALLLVRRAGRVHALADRCTHRGGPLHEGELQDGCIVCPWHGSTFALADGHVMRGPATRPQPHYETRVVDGRIEVRRVEARTLRVNPV